MHRYSATDSDGLASAMAPVMCELSLRIRCVHARCCGIFAEAAFLVRTVSSHERVMLNWPLWCLAFPSVSKPLLRSIGGWEGEEDEGVVKHLPPPFVT